MASLWQEGEKDREKGLDSEGSCNDTPDPFSPSTEDHTVLLCSKQSFAEEQLEQLGKNQSHREHMLP